MKIVEVQKGRTDAYPVTYDPKTKLYRCGFESMDQYNLDTGFYYDVREVKFTLDGPVSIGFRNQRVVKKAEVSKADWKLAKLHLQTLMSFYSPGMQHNWVHFVFPSTMAIHAPKLDPKSILRKLLDPHIRFTAVTNWSALDLKKGIVPLYLLPWDPIPMTPFLGGK